MADRESIISRYMKLKALANDPGATDAERQRALELAEALALKNEIERHELTAEQKSRIVQTTWQVDTQSAGYEFFSNTIGLMEQVIKHCGCRGTYIFDSKRRGFHVVGYREDIAHAEMIWMNVFNMFVSNINPEWDPEKSLDENTYNFIKAGFKWNDIWRRAYKAGQHPVDPYTYNSKEGGLCGRAYKREVKRRGEELKRHTQTHSAYRTSYAQAYKSKVAARLTEMRKAGEEALNEEDRAKMWPARQSTEAEVEAEFYLMYPEFDPKKQEAAREQKIREQRNWWNGLTSKEQAAYRKRQAAEQAKNERRARRSFNSQRATRATFDQAGWDRGSAIGSKVDLSANKKAGQPKKGIE